MGGREIIHNGLTLTKAIGLHFRPHVSVWSSEPDKNEVMHISLVLDLEKTQGGASVYCDLLPSEARALAAMLVMAADTQERRPPPNAIAGEA